MEGKINQSVQLDLKNYEKNALKARKKLTIDPQNISHRIAHIQTNGAYDLNTKDLLIDLSPKVNNYQVDEGQLIQAREMAPNQMLSNNIQRTIDHKNQNEDSESKSGSVSNNNVENNSCNVFENKLNSHTFTQREQDEYAEWERPFRFKEREQKMEQQMKTVCRQELLKTHNIEQKQYSLSDLQEPSSIRFNLKDFNPEKTSKNVWKNSQEIYNLTQSFDCIEEKQENMKNQNVIFKNTEQQQKDFDQNGKRQVLQLFEQKRVVTENSKNERPTKQKRKMTGTLNYRQKDRIKKILLPLEYYDLQSQSPEDQISSINSMMSHQYNFDEQIYEPSLTDNAYQQEKKPSRFQKSGLKNINESKSLK